MSEKKIQFRKAMGGYNREDVNRYIEAMNTKYYEAEEEHRKELKELRAKLEECEASAAELEELRSEKEKSDRLIVELNGTTEKLQNEKEELSREVLQLREKISELEKTNESNSEIYEKSNKYDQVSEQIGSVLLNANARAESIISEAQIKARVHVSTMVDAAMEKLNGINEKYSKEITTKTVSMTEQLRELSLSAEAFRANTQNAIENDCRELKASLETTKKIVLEGNNE